MHKGLYEAYCEHWVTGGLKHRAYLQYEPARYVCLIDQAKISNKCGTLYGVLESQVRFPNQRSDSRMLSQYMLTDSDLARLL